MLGMTNPVRHHAWGSAHDIPSLLGVEPDGSPHAELWLGGYEDESSTVRLGERDLPLSDLLAQSGEPPLPYLAKVLAVAAPLSLQLHPGSGDDVKPEMLYALQTCRLLCGFRPVGQVQALLADIAALRELADVVNAEQESLRDVMGRLLQSEPDMVAPVAAELRGLPPWSGVARLVDELVAHHPHDPAALAPLLLEPLTLSPGEAVFCAPGQPHTYLSGVGFEVQASSDAVVRGGLTSKPVDTDGFVAQLDTRAGARRLHPRLEGREEVYDAGVAEFALGVVRSSKGELPQVAGPQILLCMTGEFALGDAGGSRVLRRGDAVFVPASASPVAADGAGLLLRVTSGRAR